MVVSGAICLFLSEITLVCCVMLSYLEFGMNAVKKEKCHKRFERGVLQRSCKLLKRQ